ncbi:MAG TPA: hypothetical protein VNN79_17150 [Actinomycetota bacterium]|nr:hypothetical protein [Actinomycetota bacterium]
MPVFRLQARRLVSALVASAVVTATVVAWMAAPAGAASTTAARRTARPSQVRPESVASILRPDGSLRAGPGATGSYDARGYRMTLGAGGAPRFVRGNGTGTRALAPRVPADANWDDRFGEPGVQSGIFASGVNAVLVDGTDVYVGGLFTFGGGAPHSQVLRWDGRSWHELSGGIGGAPQGVDPEVDALALSADGHTVFVGGIFDEVRNGSTPVNANNVAAWNTQTNTWSALGDGITLGDCTDFCFLRVEALAVNGSTLYAAGSFGQAGSTAVNSIAQWNGSSWSALGRGLYSCADCPDIPGDVHALQLVGSTLYAGGSFDEAGTTDVSNIAKWNGSSWSALGDGVSSDFFQSEVDALATDGTNVYVGGDFTVAGTTAVNSLGVWNGSAWHALDGTNSGVVKSSEEGEVDSLLVDGGQLFVGGSFDHLQPGGAATQGGLAKFNLGSPGWTVLPFQTNASNVNAFAHDPDGGVYVGGSYDTGGPLTTGLYLDDIGVLNGTTWSTLGQGITSGEDGRGFGLAVTHSGTDVYYGGDFEQAGSIQTNGIAMWDGSTWHGMGSGIAGGSGANDPMVFAIAVVSGQVFIGGQFTSVGGVAAHNIAVFSGGAWHAVGRGTDGIVQALAANKGFLYVGGDFSTAGGKPVGAPAARWKLGTAFSSTAGWSKLGPVFGAGGITAIAFDGPWVFLGGDLLDCVQHSPCDHGGTEHNTTKCETFSGYDVNGLIMWNTTTPGKWYYPFGCGVTVGSGAGAAPSNVETMKRVGKTLYVGGFFDHAGILHVSPNQVAAMNVASLDLTVLNSTKTRWSALKTGVGNDQNGDSVASLSALGGVLYVAGDFPKAGGLTTRGVAQWNIGSSTWSTLGSGFGCPEGCGVPPYASGVDASANGVYFAGNFGTAGGLGSDNVARWQPPA